MKSAGPSVVVPFTNGWWVDGPTVTLSRLTSRGVDGDLGLCGCAARVTGPISVGAVCDAVSGHRVCRSNALTRSELAAKPVSEGRPGPPEGEVRGPGRDQGPAPNGVAFRGPTVRSSSPAPENLARADIVTT